MSIFIEENNLIEISVRYTLEDHGGILIVDEPETPVQEPVTLAEEPVVTDQVGLKDPKKSETVTMVFTRPDFATSQRMMSASTVGDTEGNQTINIMMLQNNLLYFLAKSWDVKDDKGNPVELNNLNIGKLRVEIARTLVTKLVEKVGQVL
jgi:hypothetical protein